MIANYTKKEQSPLKQNYPFKIRTQIWAMENYPLFIGYGSLAISNEKGIINRESDLGDLIVFFTNDDWHTIQIYYAPKMLMHLNEVMEYLSSII